MAENTALKIGSRDNALGLIRLVLACFVVISHAPELAFGSKEREPLTWAFGTISFGDLAVDGFFIISGYLIGLSYLKEPQLGPYLAKRVARIFPGYVVSYIVCLCIVLPLAGGAALTVMAAPRVIFDWLTIQPPRFIAFEGSHYPALNGPMWSLAYEFRYYVAVVLLGRLQLLPRPSVNFLLFGMFAIADIALRFGLLGDVDANVGFMTAAVVGLPSLMIRLGLMFTAGLCMMHVAKMLPVSSLAQMACLALLLLGLRSPWFVEVNVAIFGGMLIFMVAFSLRGTRLASINRANDVSYGTYLYAWPINKLILWYFPEIGVTVLTVITIALALVAGALSWFAVERPMIRITSEYLTRRRERAMTRSSLRAS
jgi:peptidoglycan/LPS O-acetylase OafA/YrhL